MRPFLRLVSVAICIALAVGCASPSARPTGSAKGIGAPVPSLADAPRATMLLEEIPLTPGPQPDGNIDVVAQPPLEALVLYARGRDAMLDGRTVAAVDLLERARATDPSSGEVNRLLGEAIAGRSDSSEASIAAYTRAFAVSPTDVRIVLPLADQFGNAERPDEAVNVLITAMRSGGFSLNEVDAALFDRSLYTALFHAGYYTAALDRIRLLQARLESPTYAMQDEPDLAVLIDNPHFLWSDAGQIQQSLGDFPAAVVSYRQAVAANPDGSEALSRLVDALVLNGDTAEARAIVTEAIVRLRGSPESLEMLQKVSGNTPGGVAAFLETIHRDHPDDRVFLFALVDACTAAGDGDRARELLAEYVREHPDDSMVVSRFVDNAIRAGRRHEAAVLLVDALHRHPDRASELERSWVRLFVSTPSGRMTLADAAALKTPPDQESARLYLLSVAGGAEGRMGLQRRTLGQAVVLNPPFAPAYRQTVVMLWDPDRPRPEADRVAACESLAESAEAGGDAALAAEVRGLSRTFAGDPAAAASHFAEAIRLGGRSPELRLAAARTALRAGDGAHGESLLWALISDYPEHDPAYGALIRHYFDSSRRDAVATTMAIWSRNSPDSIELRILAAAASQQAGRTAVAMRQFDQLLAEHPDDPRVIPAVFDSYRDAGREGEFIEKLEGRVAAHPSERLAVEFLALYYLEESRPADAVRGLDAATSVASNDPDLLYALSALYARSGDAAASLRTLERILAVDPNHPPASNDLGYHLADTGTDLSRAQRLIATALADDPDNAAYLDSMGWAFYKQSRFDEAVTQLQRAADATPVPDLVIRDHLGDALYRADRPDDAVVQWNAALTGLDGAGGNLSPDQAELRDRLRGKIDQLTRGNPVETAPVADAVPLAPDVVGRR